MRPGQPPINILRCSYSATITTRRERRLPTMQRVLTRSDACFASEQRRNLASDVLLDHHDLAERHQPAVHPETHGIIRALIQFQRRAEIEFEYIAHRELAGTQ